MTIALPALPARRGLGIDLSKPVLIAFAVILFLLIAMPLLGSFSMPSAPKMGRSRSTISIACFPMPHFLTRY